MWFDPWAGKIPWSGEWQTPPVFLPGESHGLRSLAGCSPQGLKVLDMTEAMEHTRIHRDVNQSVIFPFLLHSVFFLISAILSFLRLSQKFYYFAKYSSNSRL